MRPKKVFSYERPDPVQAARVVWIVLIAITGICLSTIFACATPFAALATLAALKLGYRDAFAVVGLAWLANQAIGYGLLGYPWTWDSAAWGLAIGVSAALAIVAAKGLSATRASVPLVVSLPFVAAFAMFELGLYVAGFVLPGSAGAFSASIVGHLFLINAVALCTLMALHQLAMISGLFVRGDTPSPQSLSAGSFR